MHWLHYLPIHAALLNWYFCTLFLRSAKESYGDKAVGYVQLKRDNDEAVCTVQAKITPEHKVHSQAYRVEAIINEEAEVLVCQCKDCPSSEGNT